MGRVTKLITMDNILLKTSSIGSKRGRIFQLLMSKPTAKMNGYSIRILKIQMKSDRLLKYSYHVSD